MSILHPVSSRWGQAVAVLLVSSFSFFIHGDAPAVSLMESRNFVAAREMVAGGSWLIPTMNGELRLAKPPLPTWAVAAVQQLSGPTADLGMLRLPAAVAALVLVLFFWGLARELTRQQPGEASAPGRTAWLAALVLASSLLVITTGREGQWDIFANSLMVGSLWLLVRGWQRERGVVDILLGGLLAGLSMLSKGPVPLYAVLLPFLLAFLVQQPQRRRLVVRQGSATLGAGVLALLVGGAWPLYIWLKVAPVALHVARTEMSSWADRHVQPFWYYWSFFAFTGLWALVALAGLVAPYARARAGRFVPYALALAWVVGGLVLLSLVPEKKERYMLPLMPPLALLVAGLIRYWESTARPALAKADVGLIRSWGALLALVAAALPVIMGVVGLPGFTIGSTRWACVVGICSGLVVWVLGQGVRRLQPRVLTGATIVFTASVLALLMPAYPAWEARKDTPGLAHIQDVRTWPQARGLADWRSLDTLHVKQAWSAGRTVPVWHPSLMDLQNLKKPVLVLAGSPVPAKLPAGWQQSVRVQRLDSFYLGRNEKSGYWHVSRIDPI
ncbi:glycosyltransferase family 39 protein [Hymenobacter sp. UYP22]|uniref:ArnT family glycosyltransferase n=1 Tax=Hymenobacter sp. UYP22 TaxID=3156348 RepID=UPI00339823DC